MCSVTAAIVVVAIIASIIGSSASPQNGVVGAVTSSFQSAIKSCTDWIGDFGKRIQKNDELMLKNSSLQAKVNDLTSDLMDYDKVKQENEFYKKYLDIKTTNPDYVMEKATLISKNSDDPYGSFTINKGSLQGISLRDPVITDEGLVGYISEVNPSFSKVSTVLDTSISCGGIDRRTTDAGVISGDLNLAKKGKTKFNNVLRSSGVATGDYIVTSGGGVFPEGIVIGTVDSIHNEVYNTALYAVVTPIVNFSELRDMMVITYFSGQGSSAE